MTRPPKCRRIASMPGVTYFKPAGIPLRMLEEVRLSLEEAEALRLKDLEGMEQEQGAAEMGVSRPTFQRVLAKARRKVADALLNGRAIRIEGGHYELVAESGDTEKENRRDNMKIAVITEDGATVSQHFGRAPLYVVATVENGKVVSKETRAKAGHHTFGGGHEAPHQPGEPHGFDAGSEAKHATMAQPISDCQVLLAGGMGMGAYHSLKSYTIEPVVTDVENIDEAVRRYLAGNLPNLMGRLH